MKTEFLIKVFTSHNDVYLTNKNDDTSNIGRVRCSSKIEAENVISKAPEGSYEIIQIYTPLKK